MGSTGLPLEAALASDWTIPYDATFEVEGVGVHRTSRHRPAVRASLNPGDKEAVGVRVAVSHMPDQESILGLPLAQVAAAESERMCVDEHCGLGPDCEAHTVRIQKDSLHSRLRSLRS